MTTPANGSKINHPSILAVPIRPRSETVRLWPRMNSARIDEMMPPLSLCVNCTISKSLR